MNIGDKVKVITKDRLSYGEIGKIVGKEMTPIGLFLRLEFDGRLTNGLYAITDLRVVGKDK